MYFSFLPYKTAAAAAAAATVTMYSIYLLSSIRYISRYTLTYTQRRRKAVKIPKILQQKRWMEVLFSNDGSLL